jgi:hypothetical protein
MPAILLHIRNSTSGLAPAADNLLQGQIAINTADANFFTLSSSGVVKMVANSTVLADTTYLSYAPYEVTASSYTLTATNYYVGVNYAGATALALPAGSGLTTNRVFIIKDESGAANTNNITITPNGTNTIDGQASVTIAINYGSLSLLWQGSRWSIV